MRTVFFKEALERNPRDIHHSIDRFKRACTIEINLRDTVDAWVDLVEKRPAEARFHLELEQACDAMNDSNYTATVWNQLVNKFPTVVFFVTAYAKAYRWTLLRGPPRAEYA